MTDLETPLVEKIRKGKLNVISVDPLKIKFGFMAKLTRDDDMWIITCFPVWNAWKSIAGFILLLAVTQAAYYFKMIDPQLYRYFLLIVPVCLLAIGLSIRMQITHPEEVAIDKTSIYYSYRGKQKEWVVDQMPVHSICRISVKSNPEHLRSAGDIVIEGKNKTIRFGWWLPNRTKKAIEKLLLSLIAADAA